MTQQQLADLLGEAGIEVTDGTVSHWELGRNNPRFDNSKVLAKILGLQMDELTPESIRVARQSK